MRDGIYSPNELEKLEERVKKREVLTQEEVLKILGSHWLANERFGNLQITRDDLSDAVRELDDIRDNGGT